MKTVCITGAGGFIGRHLCKRFADNGFHVIALDDFSYGKAEAIGGNANIEVVQADIRDINTIKDAIQKSDVIYHLASIANPRICETNSDLAFDVNVKGTSNVLSLCSDKQKIIFASTVRVYGIPKYLPLDEQHPVEGVDVYATFKLMGEHLVKSYKKIKGYRYVISRMTNAYGPGQEGDYLIPNIIRQGLRGQIEIWDPKVVRDFIYIDDAVDVLASLADSTTTEDEILNIGSGKGVTSGFLADTIAGVLNSSWVDVKKTNDAATKLVCTIDKLKSLTGWSPKTDMQDGLTNTINYWKQKFEKENKKV